MLKMGSAIADSCPPLEPGSGSGLHCGARCVLVRTRTALAGGGLQYLLCIQLFCHRGNLRAECAAQRLRLAHCTTAIVTCLCIL
jgi:hypothetical protein